MSESGQAVAPYAPYRKRGVVGVIVRGDQFLVIRRSQHVRAPGMYCFPGGAIESGETEDQAVRRELFEELSVVVRPLRRLWESTTAWNVHLAWWLVELDAGAAIQPNPLEVEFWQWLTPEQMLTLPLLPSNVEFLAFWKQNQASGPPGT